MSNGLDTSQQNPPSDNDSGSHAPLDVDKPVPRQPRTAAQHAQIQVLNRRREYIQRHPSYLQHIEHELADPVLYERLIKRHQSVAERQAEGKTKGYGRTLEADLVRGETKLSNLQAQPADGNSASEDTKTGEDAHLKKAGIPGDELWDQPVTDRAQGMQLWQVFLRERFIRGGDGDFDYSRVDADEDLDALERDDEQDAWFDQEEPSWHEDEDENNDRETPTMHGETGIQDF